MTPQEILIQCVKISPDAYLSQCPATIEKSPADKDTSSPSMAISEYIFEKLLSGHFKWHKFNITVLKTHKHWCKLFLSYAFIEQLY